MPCSNMYGVALVSRIDEIIGLFCKRALYNRYYIAKKNYNFIHRTNRSHPIYMAALLIMFLFGWQPNDPANPPIYVYEEVDLGVGMKEAGYFQIFGGDPSECARIPELKRQRWINTHTRT